MIALAGWTGKDRFERWHLLVGVGRFSLRAIEEVVGSVESLRSALTKWKWRGDMKGSKDTGADSSTEVPEHSLLLPSPPFLCWASMTWLMDLAA